MPPKDKNQIAARIVALSTGQPVPKLKTKVVPKKAVKPKKKN
jgi:hypothetical protein